jgi:hypothetical protein
MLTSQQIIDRFNMQPLADEGGFYAETYRAADLVPQSVLGESYTGSRNISTAILYLITPGAFSKLHRVESDEIFHFHLGSAVTMLQLHPDGATGVTTIGPDILNDQLPQVVVPRNTWQGCFLQEGRFALLSCTVAPGFDFDDYESAKRSELIEQYPAQKELIKRLTNPDF